jgi:acetyl-CoA carboxylase biotin carboxyl carrier protein
MDKRKLEELIRLVEDSDIQELHVSGFLRSVKIVKGGAPATAAAVNIAGHAPHQAAPAATAAPMADTTDVTDATAERDSGLVPIVSPMVGTFYAASSPEQPPYVKQGDRISVGQVVCIVEAMKLMNEIESEVSGTIVRIVKENAKPVEFGEAMFMIQPD